LTTETLEGREYPPGQHGPARARRRQRRSDYAVRLAEKQKLRHYYGVTERQLGNYVREASRKPGVTGHNLFAALERRLDNVVFRLGLARTIPAARQLVRHGHVTVDGKRVSVPGYQVSPGASVRVAENQRSRGRVLPDAEAGPILALPAYLQRDPDGLGGRCIGLPSREDAPRGIRDQLIVEYYAR
jgi:small subunit ribosomal protein S4